MRVALFTGAAGEIGAATRKERVGAGDALALLDRTAPVLGDHLRIGPDLADPKRRGRGIPRLLFGKVQKPGLRYTGFPLNNVNKTSVVATS